MPLYLVSYDIPEKDRDEYQELWDYLDTLGAVRILFSEYAVPFDGTNADLADKILKHLRTNDRLLVCELFTGDTGCAWHNVKISDAAFDSLLASARTLN
jgi:CRISPR-associated endonuclease Cas2